ncbi:MAG TPA: ABC transporter permease [bacterium]|nr:ABC transporter permease [bacterium]
MSSYVPAVPPADFPEPPAAFTFVRHVAAVAGAEIRKLRHDPLELLTRAIQPMLWLVVFGQVMARLRGVPTGRLPYLDFMAPGILAQSVLFIAIFYGIATIWERDLGILHKLLVSPATRTALVLGKALSAGVRALSQAVIVYLLTLLMHIHVQFHLANIAGVLLLVIMGSALFSMFSVVMACLVKTRERFMGIGQILTMPLFFASNAIYPLSLMPGWLRTISTINPLSYQVDGLRTLMVTGGTSAFGLRLDFGVLLLGIAVFVALAARLYPRMIT